MDDDKKLPVDPLSNIIDAGYCLLIMHFNLSNGDDDNALTYMGTGLIDDEEDFLFLFSKFSVLLDNNEYDLDVMIPLVGFIDVIDVGCEDSPEFDSIGASLISIECGSFPAA
jgi:hypothetical protein